MKAIIKKITTKLKQVFKLFCNSWLHSYLAICHSNKISGSKFIILLQGRSGSQLLGDLINSHPDIYCEPEIVGWKKWPTLFDLKAYIRYKRLERKEPVFGFRFKLRHITEVQEDNISYFLQNLHRRGWKIIYLKRENRFRQEISSLIGNQQNKWQYTTVDPLVGQQFHIDCDKLLQSIQDREKFAAQEKAIVKKVPHLALIYERDLLNPDQHQETLNKVFNFIGVTSSSISTSLVKISPKNLADIISNYEEVTSFIGQTQYAYLLKDNCYKI